ncbi:MAG TPA: T9SS type A sorting domain-containing protein [Flavobacterium sp.]|jgi:hypothetical protein|uniref:T9SS type A sorting domain-containing protein n=1 Tax=Flavobacterium sp. TaxID=239 RepID=UPI002CE6AF50|nr:T9SS type A sorting domain-containing protein [Flavobacterium sp.]MCA0349281.1 T9SS type A sorting domain-containing protein [Bacteroidota bacterium]HPW97672.1 T9SS type A sorting domain-containing protein [Flavobacterium sp.]HQA73347.1 T9SS type A sorting domain-containing protein [Flavobacterium sp.]
MKKIIVSLVCLISAMSFAQMTMKKLDGTPLNDGDVIAYSVLGDPNDISSSDPAYLGFKIYNSSNSSISVKMKCISITGGATGTNLQFCIDPICVGTISVGNSYPSNGVSTVPANGQNGNFDHFVNFDAGTGNSIVEYVLKFYMVNQFGGETGSSITLTYRYNPNLNTSGFSSLNNAGINISSTLVKSQIEFDATSIGTAQLYDLNGKLVNNINFVSGYNTINVSNLNKAVYVLNFTTQDGKNASVKVIKQ